MVDVRVMTNGTFVSAKVVALSAVARSAIDLIGAATEVDGGRVVGGEVS
jgi:hypothetical protein